MEVGDGPKGGWLDSTRATGPAARVFYLAIVGGGGPRNLACWVSSVELMRQIYVVMRYVWALPATTVGLLFTAVALCAGATMRFSDGVIEVAGGRADRIVSLLPASARFVAITFGHVIIGIDHAVLRRVRLHEHVHVRQYERWGLLFFPLYVASSLMQLLHGLDPYLNNCFEREAHKPNDDA